MWIGNICAYEQGGRVAQSASDGHCLEYTNTFCEQSESCSGRISDVRGVPRGTVPILVGTEEKWQSGEQLASVFKPPRFHEDVQQDKLQITGTAVMYCIEKRVRSLVTRAAIGFLLALQENAPVTVASLRETG